MNQNFESVDEYIQKASKETQPELKKLRALIKKLVPDAKETISYQIPTYKLNKPVIHFAAYKKHIGVYTLSSTLDKFPELKKYLKGKDSLNFPLTEPIPYDLIEKAIKYKLETKKL